jgi:hypothetical protein
MTSSESIVLQNLNDSLKYEKRDFIGRLFFGIPKKYHW